MKNLMYTFLFLIISTVSAGQKHIDYDFFPYETTVKTIKFKVLDINFEKKLLAFKHIFELQDEYSYGEEGELVEKPVDCKYAGMEKYPKAGVVLGIYDLEKGEYLKTITIYKSCFELKDCYKHEFSSEQLELAKQIFKDNELDIENNPKALIFKEKSEDKNYLNVDGITFTSSYFNDYDNQLTTGYLYSDEIVLYYTKHDDNFAMASNGEVFCKTAYRAGEKIIFLFKYFHNNNMEGPRSAEFHYFSPVFTIKNNIVSPE